jgi:exopolysaccharide biosynthesis polyprenyl glycosylphosphotransferase
VSQIEHAADSIPEHMADPTEVDRPIRDVPVEDVVDERTRELLRRSSSSGGRTRGWLIRRALVGADVVGLIAAFLVAQWIAGPKPDATFDRVGPLAEVIIFAATLPMWILGARLYGLYDRDEERADHSTVDDVTGVLNVVTIGAWLSYAGSWLTGIASPKIGKVVLFWIAAVVLVSLSRAACRAFCRRRPAYVQNTLIVGAGRVGQLAARKLLQHPEYGVNLVGFVDEHPMPRHDDIGDLTLLGRTGDLCQLVSELDIERVIVAYSRTPLEDTLETIRRLNELNVQVDIIPRFFEVLGNQVALHSAEGLPLLGLPRARLSRSALALKRVMDVMLSAFALFILSPLLAVIALAIKLDSPGPVFFRQVRRGRGNTTFCILKFRTMAADADERKHEFAHLNKHLRPGGDPRMFKLRDDPRISGIGRFLRTSYLDELPQLWNVLKGEMSLVGPRPLILEEDQRVNGWGRRRLDLKPGMTGLWQVLGRDDIPFGEMVGLDYRYVTSWSLFSDVRLLFRTIPIMVGRHGS